MVDIKDNIGRSLYTIDTTTGKRLHPFTGESVRDDFEYQYNSGVDVTFKEALPGLLLLCLIIGGVITGIVLLIN